MGDQDEADDARDKAFDALLKQSSLGGEGARLLRERTPLSRASAARRIAALRRHIARPAASEADRLASVRELHRLLESLGYRTGQIPEELHDAAPLMALAPAADTVDPIRQEQASTHLGEPSHRQSSTGRASAPGTRTSDSQGTRERPVEGPGLGSVLLQETGNAALLQDTALSSTAGDQSPATHTGTDHAKDPGGDALRLWHITLTVTGPARPLAEVRRALEQLADDHPSVLTSRYDTDHAEIRYWGEAGDLHDAAALAMRLWHDHRNTTGLAAWQIQGLEVIDRQTYHQRIAEAGAAGPSTDEPLSGRGKVAADHGRPSGSPA